MKLLKRHAVINLSGILERVIHNDRVRSVRSFRFRGFDFNIVESSDNRSCIPWLRTTLIPQPTTHDGSHYDREPTAKPHCDQERFSPSSHGQLIVAPGVLKCTDPAPCRKPSFASIAPNFRLCFSVQLSLFILAGELNGSGGLRVIPHADTGARGGVTVGR